MNPSEAEKQISQMIEFIKQEAREKADEIGVKTEAEFNAKKLTAIQAARNELNDEYTKKRKEASSRKRITRSRMINEARLNEMRERDKILKELKVAVLAQLAGVSAHPKYKEFIRVLLVQGFMTIMESKVDIRCREVDVSIVQSQVDSALAEFKRIVHAQTGIEPRVEVSVNTKEYLSPPPSKDSVGLTCAGGVVLTARGGKIVCRNTLDARFELAYENLLPVTREIIFGRRADVRKPPKAEEKHH